MDYKNYQQPSFKWTFKLTSKVNISQMPSIQGRNAQMLYSSLVKPKTKYWRRVLMEYLISLVGCNIDSECIEAFHWVRKNDKTGTAKFTI